MCGIIAILAKGNINIIDVMITGLKQLQNRGYDSAGISFYNKDTFENIKFASKNKFLICSIIGRGKSKTDDAKADGEQTAEAGEAKSDG